MDLLQSYKVFAPVYDAYTTETGDLPFYRKLARECGGPVLELACGTGRVTLALAAAGVEIWGLDFCDDMLDRCRARLARRKPQTRARVRLIRGDMRSFSLRQRFPLAILPFSSFLHLLDLESQLSCLRTVRRHLTPDGLFALDVVMPSYYLLYKSSLGEAVTTDYGISQDGDGYFCSIEEEVVDLATQVSTCSYQLWDCDKDGRYLKLRTRFALRLRYVFATEMRLLFMRAGFRDIQVYGDFQRRAYRAGSDRLVVVARR